MKTSNCCYVPVTGYFLEQSMCPKCKEHCELENEMSNIEEAMNILREVMQEDPAYAFSWHCNIAMACYDSMIYGSHEEQLEISNEAAARFMKLCFDATTSKDMLENNDE